MSLLCASTILAVAAPTPELSMTSDVRGRKLGYCGFYGCLHGSRDKWWAPWDCSCDSAWEGRCCDVPKECTGQQSVMCPQERMAERTTQCADVTGDGPIRVGGAPLPKQFRGVFWLMDQGDSSALMSFSQDSRDGDGLSKLDMEAEFQFKIRVGGDRIWSFHEKAASWGLVEALDLIYNFRFEDAAGNRPTRAEDTVAAQIIPSSANLLDFTLDAPGILSFRMELLADGTHEKYPNSVVWGRPSSVLGVEGGYYDLVQVIDGDGNKVQPAFDDWVAYCNTPETGDTLGNMWYREAE